METNSLNYDEIIRIPTKQHDKKTYPFYIDNTIENKRKFHYPNNTIKTTKYNILTFLPKSLLYQFMRVANCYFLFTAILNCIPIISPLGSGIAMVPIIFVLSVSLMRELIEDIIRARLDQEQNANIVELFFNGQWIKVKSGELQVGQIVKVNQDGTFPADLIILTSNLPEGLCYIETGTLDGEKSLKIKQSLIQTALLLPDDTIGSISGYSICDLPNPFLYHLIGRLMINIKGTVLQLPLDSKQLLLKGAKLRNTKWVIGIVLYAGNNSKIMLNAKKPTNKYSKIESLMNKMLIVVLVIQITLCIIAAILHKAYYSKNLISNEFFNKITVSPTVESVINYFSYVLLMNTMIPISLIITMEIVKIIQVILILWDAEGYSMAQYRSIKPNSVNLNEELGMVDYIFTDKTGTLTCNKMEFKYCVIGEICYESTEDKTELQILREEKTPLTKGEIMASQTEDKLLISTHTRLFDVKKHQKDNTSTNSIDSMKIMEEFWKALALCHDCTIDGIGDKEQYLGLSPDNIELVKAARLQGYKFTDSGKPSIKRIQLGNFAANYKDYEKLLFIEFSSERKRETIVVKESNVIKMFIKGADNVIEERLSQSNSKVFLNQSKKYVNEFAARGYRTLFVGMKVIDSRDWEIFNAQLTEANLDLTNKESKLNQLYDSLERDINLLGATIVEDKLQDQVSETIRDLKLAGIKIWMLTGDKMSTAFNIALSCHLLNNNLKTFFIEGIEIKRDQNLKITNKNECEEVIIKFAKLFNNFAESRSVSKQILQFAIVIDEKALLTVCDNKEISRIFLNIAKDSQTVVCCRVSPLQKSEVVKMIKEYDLSKISLGIGDGGNDVSMIMEAHIGIGIYGEEGLRAVQSSDYAIGEFKILRRLLLFHGRTNNIRICDMILYFFYKNFIFTLIQFFFGFYNNFSGQTIIDDWFINMYNLLLTAFPLGARACCDFDVKPEDGTVISQMMPFLYSENRSNPHFNKVSFVLSLLKGLVHGLLNFFLTIYIFYSQPINTQGDIADIWVISVALYTNIILIVSLDLFINTKYITWINLAIFLLLTLFSYLIFIIIVHYWTLFNSVATMEVAFSSGTLWLGLILIYSICAGINMTINTIDINFRKKISHILEKLVSRYKKINDARYIRNDLIKEKLNLYLNYEIKDSDNGIQFDGNNHDELNNASCISNQSHHNP